MRRLFPWLLPVITFLAGWCIGAAEKSERALAEEGRERLGGTTALSAVPSSRVGAPSKAESPDDARTLEKVHAQVSSLRRSVEFQRLIQGLDATGLAALYAQIANSRNEEDGKLKILLFQHWGRLAPEAAMIAAQAADMLYPALRGWAEKDPLAALKWCDEHLAKPESGFISLRNDVLEFAIPKPGKFPPMEAIRRIAELPVIGDTPPAISNGIADILRDWAAKDPEAAWRAALTSEELKADRKWALSSLLYACASSDPARCKAWVEAMPEGPDRNAAIASLASALAWNNGIDAGRSYALTLGEGEARQHALANVAEVIASRDPQGFGPFMAGLKPSDIQDPTLFEQVFAKWYEIDSSRAGDALKAHLTSTVSPTKEQERNLKHLLFSWTAHDPRNAAEFSLGLPSSIREQYLAHAVSNFVGRDAPAAAKWASEIPDADLRDQVLGNVVKTWSYHSIPKVTDWLNVLPITAGKPATVEAFAQTMISTKPDDALTWLRALPDEADRLQRLNRVWNSWSDRGAAHRWRESSGTLTPAERAALKGAE